MSWSEEDLWQKAKLFISYASDFDREDSLFALWSVLGLELLARAALAHVHPCLLADIRNNDEMGENLLHACGIPSEQEPVSVKAKTVFARCTRVVKDFGPAEKLFCNELMRRRNVELHTGAPVLEEYSTSEWLARYYAVAQLLLVHLGRSLADLFGTSEAKVADEMIRAADDKLKKVTLDAISAKKKEFAALSEVEQARRRADSKNGAKPVGAALLARMGDYSRSEKCPSCGETCRISGKGVQAGTPKLDEDGDVVINVTVMPVKLECKCCGLLLDGHAQLHAAGLGGQFTSKEVQDPVEFHNIDLGEYLADYYEPEYDNE